MSINRAAALDRIPESSNDRLWRATSWIAVSVVLFILLLLTTLFVASILTSELGVGSPEREHFAAVHAVLFGISQLVTVPVAGRLLGQVRSMWPGVMATTPFLLAAVTNYLLFEDVRSGHLFDTDRAVPELFVPLAIALLGAAGVGLRVATTGVSRRAWSWFSVAAAIMLLVFVALTMTKASAGLGGMYQLDSPLTFAALAAAAVYALAAIGRGLPAWRR